MNEFRLGAMRQRYNKTILWEIVVARLPISWPTDTDLSNLFLFAQALINWLSDCCCHHNSIICIPVFEYVLISQCRYQPGVHIRKHWKWQCISHQEKVACKLYTENRSKTNTPFTYAEKMQNLQDSKRLYIYVVKQCGAFEKKVGSRNMS